VTQAEAPREAALRRAAWQRFRHAWAGLGRVVQVQIFLGAIGLPALLADYAQRFYTSNELVAWIVRVDALLVLLLGLLLARLGPGLFLRAPDEAFLATTPLSGGARFRYRAWQLALLALPAMWLGTGGVLPLLWNGDPGLFACGLALWLAWAAFAWAFCAAIAGLAPAPGRGQSLFETIAGALPALLMFGSRQLTGLAMKLERRESLLVTAAIGAVLAWALARGAARSHWLHERRERTLEAMRGRADSLRSSSGRRNRPRALPRWPKGAWALVARDFRVATRSPRVGGPWLGALLLKGLAFASVLAPGAAQAGRPWALAGAALLLGDALLGAAVIAQMEHEWPHLFFGAPLSHARRWWGEALPALLLSALSALALAAVAWASPDGGAMTARFILAWCLLAGLSLVATAANLALASFPETGVAQNLFWLGLLVCLILSAVIPLFGWVVLVAFALYSFRQLRHWGPN
jgi:hypothetical protein